VAGILKSCKSENDALKEQNTKIDVLLEINYIRKFRKKIEKE